LNFPKRISAKPNPAESIVPTVQQGKYECHRRDGSPEMLMMKQRLRLRELPQKRNLT